MKQVLRYFRYWTFRRHRAYFMFRWSKQSLKLHLGCGNIRMNGYINIDLNYTPATDYVTDARKLPCRDNSVEAIETYHVIEHIPFPEIPSAVQEWYRVLIPGGQLVIECPNFDEALAEYLDGNEERLYSIYGRQRFKGDTHYWGYNARRLKNLLMASGFSKAIEAEAQDRHKNEEPCLRMEATK